MSGLYTSFIIIIIIIIITVMYNFNAYVRQMSVTCFGNIFSSSDYRIFNT